MTPPLNGPGGCARFDALLETSLEGPLEPALQADFDAHLAACPACVEGLKGYVTTTQLLQELRQVEQTEPVAPLPESLVKRLLAARAAEQEGDSKGVASA